MQHWWNDWEGKEKTYGFWELSVQMSLCLSQIQQGSDDGV
jgi:hypothetical protein